MLVKHAKGYSFYNALNYILGKPGAQWLDGNTPGRDPISLEQQFNQIAMVRPNVKRRLYHCALSLPTDEHLDDQTWRHIARDYLEQMGFGGHQYIAVRHTDTPSHEHIHIVANRVGQGRTIAQDSWDHYRAQVVAQDLETTYGLQPSLASWQTRRHGLSKKQLEKAINTGKPAMQRQLQDTIDDLLPECSSFPEFMDALDHHDIGLRVHYGFDDQAIGLSYTKDGVTMSGSSLGRGYSFDGIREQLDVEVELEITLHDPELVQQSRAVMMNAIAPIASEQPMLPELIERLDEVGIEAHVIYQKRQGGRFAKSIAYGQDGISFSGEALGSEYHLKGLQDEPGVNYIPGRDDHWIHQWQGYKSGKQNRPVPAAHLKNFQRFENSADGVAIAALAVHQVYVFGSSEDGQHETGAGLALYGIAPRQARKYGVVDQNRGERAIWGQGRGYQVGNHGNSYAIATKRLWTHKKSIPVEQIQLQLETFSQFAATHPEQEFIVGRFHDRVMRHLWAKPPLPSNVQLPKGWNGPRIEAPPTAAKLRRVMISGDTAIRFSPTTRNQAIGYLKQGVETAFQTAHAAGYQQLEFVSSLRSGVEHWGAVAALQLREAQKSGELPGTPVIRVIAAQPQPAGKLRPEQERVLEAIDRVETKQQEELLRNHHDQLLFVQLREDARSSDKIRQLVGDRQVEAISYQVGKSAQQTGEQERH
ncbi:relaxase/mobilization nuclease domain-containing protein [filamentous cyanobacterium LEGE 11480]|uniref:Relaxase/mobilization nuclease domain-containing protein n=1 Tax=Romeriopsis navalis LEGE 11480 TaxID=2777977 RepID=A0A928VPP5_9CYAN|nr:relaxase/mobilization nuclease domain-containing protein [Romeriopsis navalis]MBE9032406.1 relaxase/mobilization nuclease domain-containing protein [Romeriopsis navalis LEGE 11480]